MAYATTTQHPVNTSFQPVYAAGWEEILYKNYWLGLTIGGRPLFEPHSMNGDNNYRWKVHVSGGTPSTFSEGDAAAAPGVQLYVNAAVAAVYFTQTVRVSGHLRDAARGAALYSGLPVIDQEFTLAMEDMRDLIGTTFLGATNSGLEVAVDSTTAYAGLNRATYTNWGSTETALSGALSRTHLIDQMEFARDNEKGSSIGRSGNGIVLAPVNQCSNYIRLTGEVGGTTPGIRFEAGLFPNGFDVSPSFDGLRIMGVPMIGIPDMLDTIIVGMDTRPGKNLLCTCRDFTVRGPVIMGDDDEYYITWAGMIVDKNPKYDWKSTGVTA